MAEHQLTLTEEERAFLAEFLQTALKNVLVEEHRTRTPSYREIVVRQELLINGLLAKLGQPTK